MKKTIYLLCSLAFLNVAAFGQNVDVYQGSSSKQGKVNITQEGGRDASSYQLGTWGEVKVDQTSNPYTPNTNYAYVGQYESKNVATLLQTGENNEIVVYQIGGVGSVDGNLVDITQSGMGNNLRVEQVQNPVGYGNHAVISQTGNGGNIILGQVGLVGGNNAWISQSSDNSDLRVFEYGSYNSVHATQTNGANNVAYLKLDNSASATSLGNDVTLLQQGTNNWFALEVIGDDNWINVEQIGDNNMISSDYNTYGLGNLTGNGNTIYAIQHGNDLTGKINIGDVHNSTIYITSIPRS